ncbi:uncharacterized protein LOC132201789 isoform X2 [Neocloeon triangulifer]|uniref:uncharacterized protein LOC132201789 isoform X2 n=1 Tax=Neocloeon triangulifer TaxID=2078957 RepID=UPI00286EBF8B|nr:uncharacterized protein LOC132201789 isoform X2 [Neocloeon triangulifer]
MDMPEQEYPILHPEYSPVLTFLYQNLPFLSIFIGCPMNIYAIRTLQNAYHLPIRGLAMLWCSCNFLSILVVESLFLYESHSEEWSLGGFACKLYKSFSMLPVCINPWFVVASVVSFSRLLPLRGTITWILATLTASPLVYMFYMYGNLETTNDVGALNLTVSSCAHAASKDEFYWTNVLSFILYFNTPVVVAFCFLVFSYQLQQNKTAEWSFGYKIVRSLFLSQCLCWLPHWVDLFYLTKANDAFSDTTLAFLVVEAFVFLHIGVLVPLTLRQYALRYSDLSVHLNPLEPTVSVAELHGVQEEPKDWP